MSNPAGYLKLLIFFWLPPSYFPLEGPKWQTKNQSVWLFWGWFIEQWRREKKERMKGGEKESRITFGEKQAGGGGEARPSLLKRQQRPWLLPKPQLVILKTLIFIVFQSKERGENLARKEKADLRKSAELLQKCGNYCLLRRFPNFKWLKQTYSPPPPSLHWRTASHSHSQLLNICLQSVGVKRLTPSTPSWFSAGFLFGKSQTKEASYRCPAGSLFWGQFIFLSLCTGEWLNGLITPNTLTIPQYTDTHSVNADSNEASFVY